MGGPDAISARPGPQGDTWQLLVDSASDAYVSIDAGGSVIRWNRRAAEVFGWEPEEAVGRLLGELIIPPEHREAHLRGLERFIATGQARVAFQRLQLPALHKNGRRLDVVFTILPIEEDDGWRFHAFLHDITDELTQQRYVRLLERVALAANEATSVEAALRRCLEELQVLTGSRAAHAYLVDGDRDPRLRPSGWWYPGPIEPLASDTARRVFGLGEGLPGRVALDGEPAWISDVQRDPDFPRAAAAGSAGIRAALAFPVMSGDRPVAVIELFREDPGEPEKQLLDVMGSVGTQLGRVFERQRAMDEVLRLANDREAIIAIVGHELRGPLAAAHAATGMLVDDLPADDGENGPLLQLLDRQLARLRRLVDMFLTAQRLEAGSLTVRARAVPLATIVQEVAMDGDFEDVEVDVDESLAVHADRDHVAQMVWNLLGNASRHGEPPIEVRARRDGDRVLLAVADHGPGVPEDLRGTLFERFARGSRSQGTGLGLSIVLGLAQANGGDARYVDDPTPTFTVELPAA